MATHTTFTAHEAGNDEMRAEPMQNANILRMHGMCNGHTNSTAIGYVHTDDSRMLFKEFQLSHIHW